MALITLKVTTISDENDGGNGGRGLSLRDALLTAQGKPQNKYRIQLRSGATYRLTQSGSREQFGKTNIPRLSYDWQCQHPTAGRANNPWDLSRTPGGSSGGAAAALAAGFTPLELGSDVAGSIRLPAHFCGVCGLRPTEGSLPDAGHMAIPGMPHTI